MEKLTTDDLKGMQVGETLQAPPEQLYSLRQTTNRLWKTGFGKWSTDHKGIDYVKVTKTA